MLVIYKFISRILQFLLNVLFVLQITLMVLVFLTATYWLFGLLHLSYFDFVKPIANFVSDLVRMFHFDLMEAGGVVFDGSILIFDIFGLLTVFVISKLKYYIHKILFGLHCLVENCEYKIEERFNLSLKKQMEESVKKCNNTAVLIQFHAKNMMVDNCWDGDSEKQAEEKEEEAFKVLYAALKNLSGCKFAKTGDKMLILLSDFEKVDNLLNFIDLSVNRIKLNMKKKRWLLQSNIAVDVYDNETNFKDEVYPLLEKLLSLDIKNEAVCLGNFCLRYELLYECMFTTFLKGSYDLNDMDCEVWSLVKKN